MSGIETDNRPHRIGRSRHSFDGFCLWFCFRFGFRIRLYLCHTFRLGFRLRLTFRFCLYLWYRFLFRLWLCFHDCLRLCLRFRCAFLCLAGFLHRDIYRLCFPFRVTAIRRLCIGIPCSSSDYHNRCQNSCHSLRSCKLKLIHRYFLS